MATQDENERKKLMEEYNDWKKNAPLLYDMILTHNLTWPSLTCQWLPKRTLRDKIYQQELLIGTHTNDEEDNYVKYLNLDLPEKEAESYNASKTKMYITQEIKHEGEVNRARYQPFQPDIIATKTREGDVLLFDRKKDGSNACQPILRLKGHSMEGYGLAWNPHISKKDHLLSAGYDKLICHWDVNIVPANGMDLQPLQVYQGHTDSVGDVSWNSSNNRVFASVGDDMKLLIWDYREPTKPVQNIKAHENEINSVEFHPNMDWMLATGSSDKTIGLWDVRKLNSKLHSLELHEGDVTQIAWSPHDDPIIASAGADRKIIVWDLRRIGEEQKPEDAEDGPPELMFVHSGHTSRISDFSWNPSDRWVLASAAEDNVVQVWQMAKDIYSNTDSLKIDKSKLE